MKKNIFIAASVLIVISVAVLVGINYFGQKAFDALVDSVGTVNIEQDVIKKVEEAQISIPEIPKTSEEPQKTNEEQQRSNEAAKNNEQKNTQNVVSATPKPVKKEVSIEDKAQAISLIKSKFSAGEIAQIQSKISKGLTSQDIAEIKSLVKSRVSAEEIAKIREWYTKYK